MLGTSATHDEVVFEEKSDFYYCDIKRTNDCVGNHNYCCNNNNNNNNDDECDNDNEFDNEFDNEHQHHNEHHSHFIAIHDYSLPCTRFF